MSFILKYFTIDITPGALPPVVHVSEYDTGRQYGVTITDGNGPFSIPLGATATVEGTLNGTVGFTTSATISNNQITFALTESMTAYAGKAWCKIKLTLNSEPIQTCAFVLAVDRAGVEADTVIGADGFEQQIVDAVNDWLDEHPPASGGMTEEFKQALLDCFENVAWINDQGQTYYDALYAALYPPVDVLSISAVFTQGEAVIYVTDSLDTLKQYLVVTATMTDSTTQTVTNYTLSGTLTEGTSTITVLYNGKTTTFSVTVSSIDSVPTAYQKLTYIGSTGTQYIDSGVVPSNDFGFSLELAVEDTITDHVYDGVRENSGDTRCWVGFINKHPDVGWNVTQVNYPATAVSYESYEFAEVSVNMFNDRKVYVGDVDCTLFGTLPTLASFTKSFYLLGIHGSSGSPYLLASRLASARFTKGSEIIKNFVPVERKSDNVLGLYETINGVFYTNDGTGTFVRGANAF